MKSLLAAFVGLALAAWPASAVIIVSGTDTGSLDTTGLSAGFTYNLQGSGNAIVFGAYVDQDHSATNILFDGAAPTGTIQDGRSFLAYLYNPDPSVDITFNVDFGNPNGGYFLYELSNVDTGVLANLGTGAAITTTSDDRFIVDYMGINFSDGAGASPDPGSIVSSFTITDFNGAIGGGALGSGSGLAGAAGTHSLGWTGAAFTGEVSAAFVAAAGGPVAWNVNGGGNWSAGGNWTGGSPPTAGGESLFGDALTAPNAPADISLDVAVNAGKITFSNLNRYNITGPQTLTLSGAAEITAGSGTHEISAVIAGASGLTKSGGGNLVLSGVNTYSGLTTVQGGSLQAASVGAVPGGVSLAAAGELAFVAGYNGAFAGDISGSGNVLLDSTLTTETVSFSGAKSLAGTININGGTLAVSNSGALGSGDGTPATQTRVNDFGGLGNGKLALSGNINIANELLVLGPRRGEGVANLIHLTSAGANTWGGNIQGDANGDNYNFESTSGVLTLSGTLSAPDGDAGVRNFVFSGAGDFDVSSITDFSTNANGDVDVASLNTETNVFVQKLGAGTLTIRTASNQQNDYWQGGTVIESGTVEVISDGANGGELWGPIEVRSGATLDIDHFGTYSLQVGQSLSGGGTVRATGKTVAIFDDNSISPGDSVGALTINGNATLSSAGGGGGVLSFELGNDPSVVGGTENDLIQINGSLSTSGAPNMTVSVTAAEGEIVAGQYRLISHTGGAVNVSGLTPLFLDQFGNPLTARQTLGVSSASGQVNLDVTGSSANLTWTGAIDAAWDKNATANWNDGGPETFFDQDQVTFDDSAGENDTVDISGGDVYPALATFDSATGNTYTVTGSNGFGGTTPINLTGDVTLVLNNTNTLQGNINIAADATLDIGTGGGASTVSGNISGPGTLVVGGGFVPFTTANSLTGPILVNGGQMVPSNADAFGSTDAGTTINAGGTIRLNFANLLISEALTFNGGSFLVTGNDGSATTLTGAIDVTAAGAGFQVANNLGDDALVINSNISGAASGAIDVAVGGGSTMTVTGNITNNGAITKVGIGSLALGATTTVAAQEVIVNEGILDVSAKSSHTLGSGQTLSGNGGTVLGSVTAANGSTVRVGDAGLPQQASASYIDATWGEGGNTTFANGSTFTPTAGNFQGGPEWQSRVNFGNDNTILQGLVGANTDQAPVLKTTLSGLVPNQEYTVFVNFWDANGGWRILAGSAENDLDLYAPPGTGVAGQIDGVDPSTLNYDSAVLTANGDQLLWAGPMGVFMADGSGNIEIYFDEQSGPGGARTWYDGITLSSSETSAVAQSFTIDGDLTLGAGSTLELDLGTPDRTDLLTITGALVAGGVLDVTLDLTVPAPSEGDVFDLLDFTAASGAFNSFNLPSLGAGLSWDTSSLLTTGELSVVAGIGLAGDFNNDGVVDAADYTVWRDGLAGNVALPNDNGLGTPISSAHYDLWRMNYGAGGGGASASAPEPTSIAVLAAVAFGFGIRRKLR